MEIIIDNPFVITGYIAPAYFCDREKETADLVANIRNGRNTALISDRRMGKTGLIEHVYHQREIAENYYTFLIDIYPAGTLREFVFLLSKQIFETLKPRGRKFVDRFIATIASLRAAFKFDTVTGAPVFDIGLGDILQPESSLEEIFAYLEKADRRCVVAIDEFQQIARFPEKNTEALLRTYIQRCKNTNFIFSGSIHHMMRELFFTASRPFYQSVSPMSLGAIAAEKYIAFVAQFFEAAGVQLPAREIERVYTLFEGHTWYMQAVFNELYARSARGTRLDTQAVKEALLRVVQTYEPIYQGIAANLSERQKELLLAIAKEGVATEITSAEFVRRHALQSASSVQAAARQLVSRELVVKEPTRYVITDRFFAIWLQITYGAGLIWR